MTNGSRWLLSALFAVSLGSLSAWAEAPPPPSDAPRAGVIHLAPSADPAQKPAARPPQTVSRPNFALLGVGAGAATVSYGLALGSALIYGAIVWPIHAAATKDNAYSGTMAWLFVPLVGPIFSAQTDLLKDERGLRNLMYVDSAVQVASLGLILAGIFMRHDVTVTPDEDEDDDKTSFLLGPGPGGSAGLSVMLALD